MLIVRTVIAAGLGVALAGCSTVVDGRHQTLTVKSDPAGADCSIDRKGEVIARINPTPGTVTIRKTKDDITIVCRKDGYETASLFERSGVTTATYGNILLGLSAPVGWGVDSATGADNNYEAEVTVLMTPARKLVAEP